MIERKRRPTHPGAILKELYLDGLHVEVSEFAAAIGISRKTVSAIINGHRRVTPEMAARFAKAIPNTTPDMWLNLQMACDIYEARKALAHIDIAPIYIPSDDGTLPVRS